MLAGCSWRRAWARAVRFSLGATFVLGASGLGGARPARANGAFPDSVGILLPADRPDELVLATNFGLISTADGGQTWLWSCEQNIAAFASLYQIGPPPLDRIFTLSGNGLLRTDDGSCTWAAAGGMASAVLLTDFFADPTDPMKLLAVALPDSADVVAEVVLRSTDGGETMGAPIYTGPIKGGLTGVESARTDPNIIYLASYETPGLHPRMIKSTDGGETWAPPVDIEPSIGPSAYRIIAVDPVDPQTIYLRVTEPLAESLAISTDGGQTFSVPVRFGISLTAFARLSSGTILVAGTDPDANGNPPLGVGYRSTDGGKSFVPWTVPHLRALAERDGKLYAAADNTVDGFALGVSTDEGMTFSPLMTYDKVTAVAACVSSSCGSSCHMQAMLRLWSDSVCPAAPDAGADGGGDDSGVVDASAPADAAPPLASGKSGCGCAVGGERGASLLALALLAAAQVLRRARRRRPGVSGETDAGG